MKGSSTLRVDWIRGLRIRAVTSVLSLDVLVPLGLVALSLLLFFQGIQSRVMWASHEARAAQNAQRMLDDGNWLLPRLYDGQVELQKPAGFYWLVAGLGKFRGEVDAWAVRLPAAAAGTLVVLLLWWHLRGRGRPAAGFLAAASLAGAVHFTGTARIGRIDVPLALAVSAILLIAREPLPWRRRTVVGIGVLAGIALLLKGPIGLMLPAVVLATCHAVERIPIRRMAGPALGTGAVALVVAGPWYLSATSATDGEFARVFFLYHHFNRAFGGAEALAGHPWWYYIPRFAADFLPWSPLLIVALLTRRWRGDADARFGLVWFAVMIAVLSVSRFKRADYLLPAYPGAAMFLGCALERWYQQRPQFIRRRAAIAFVSLLTVLPAGWIVFDHFVTSLEEAAREQAPFAHRVREIAPAPARVTFFQVESHLLAYHLGRPVHTLVEWADLTAQVREPGCLFVIARADCLDELRHRLPTNVEVLARNEDVARSKPHRSLVLLRIPGEPCPKNPPKD